MFYLPPLQLFFEIFQCFYLLMQYFYLDKNEIKLLHRLWNQTFLGTCLFLFGLKFVIIIFLVYVKDKQSLRVKFNCISFEENKLNVDVYRFFIRTTCSHV